MDVSTSKAVAELSRNRRWSVRVWTSERRTPMLSLFNTVGAFREFAAAFNQSITFKWGVNRKGGVW